MQQLQVNILDDDVVESTEQFSVVLNSQDAKVTIGTHGTATVSIIDNDRKYFTRSAPELQGRQVRLLPEGPYCYCCIFFNYSWLGLINK